MCMATWENGRDFLLPPLRFNTELENTHTQRKKKIWKKPNTTKRSENHTIARSKTSLQSQRRSRVCLQTVSLK